MSQGLRKSGIKIIKDIVWGTHFCQFYQTQEDLMDILIPYFKAGLENNELCIWAIPESFKAEEEAIENLRKAIPQLDIYLGKGQIEIIPSTDWYLNEGIFNSERALKNWIKKVNHALKNGYSGLRLTEDFSWLKKDWNNLIDYEEKLDALIGSHRMTALCTYSLNQYDATEAIDAAMNHRFALVKRERKWKKVENPGLKRAEEATIQAAKEVKTKSKEENENLEKLLEERTVELEKAYKSLKESEECLAQAQKMAHIGNWKWDIVTGELHWSDEVYRIFGRNPEEFGETYDVFLRYVHPDDREYLVNAIKKGFDRELQNIDYRITLPDGEVRTVHTQAEIFFDEKNIPVRAEGIVQDITERKRTEEALQEREEQYRAFFENSIDAVLLTSPDGTIYAANPAACKIFGMTEEEITRVGRNGIVDVSDPRLKPGLEERARTGKFRGELNYRRKDGTIFPGEVSSAFFKDKNGLVKTVMIIRDITERKQIEETLRKSEEHYRMLFANMTEAFFFGEIIYDKHGKPYDYRFLEVNPAFELHAGVKGEQVLGKSHLEVFHKVDHVVVEKYGQVALSGKPIHFEFFTQLTNRYLDIHVFSPEQGKFAATFRDITEREQMEEKTRQRAEEVETVMEVAPVAIWIGHDPKCHNITGNRMANEFYEAQLGENVSANVTPVRRFFYKGLELTVDELPMQKAAFKDIDVRNEEFDVLLPSGEWRTLLGSASPLHDADGHVRGIVAAFIDITERKRMEEALRENEERFTAFMDNSPAIAWMKDEQGRHIYLNKSYENHFNVRLEDWRGKTDFELWPFKFANQFRENDRAVLKGDQTIEVIEETPSPEDDSTFWWNFKFPFQDASDKKYVGGIGIDITERKRMEEALKKANETLEEKVKERTAELEKAYNSLKESEASLAEAQKMAHIGNWDWDLATNELYASDEMCRIFGLNSQEFDATYEAFLNYVHPADRDYIITAFKDILNGKKLVSTDYRIVSAEGEERIVHGQGEVIFNEGNIPVRMRGTIQDITELKRTEKALELSEERYRIIAEQTGQLVYDYNVEGNTSDWAGNIEEITGYTPDKFRNMNLQFWISRIHPEDRKMFLESYERFLSNGGIYRTEYRFRKENGEYIFLEDHGVCLKDEEGKVERILGATKNITERKQAEKALANIETARKREIHHRIKNNLQVISSLLDLQAEKFKDRKHTEDSDVLAAFKESQDRVLSIALIHEELHEGKGTDKLNFCPYLEKLVENLFETYRVGNVDLSLNMDLEENIFFDIDVAVPLGLIVNEIVSNSLKYAFSGRNKGIIQIKLCKEENVESVNNTSGRKKGNYKNKVTNFILTVSDNGVGIPENINLGDSDTLGLQLIVILVDQLEGKLELKRDSGTEFVIKFAITEKE